MKKHDIVLSLDTSETEKISVVLTRHDKTIRRESHATRRNAQNVLPLIAQVLQDARLAPSQLTQIRVRAGDGSFTGIRIGLSVANILGFLFGIPVIRDLSGSQSSSLYGPSKFDSSI